LPKFVEFGRDIADENNCYGFAITICVVKW